jgi:hypothetical protein
LIEVKIRRTGQVLFYDVQNYLAEIKALLANG